MPEAKEKKEKTLTSEGNFSTRIQSIQGTHLSQKASEITNNNHIDSSTKASVLESNHIGTVESVLQSYPLSDSAVISTIQLQPATLSVSMFNTIPGGASLTNTSAVAGLGIVGGDSHGSAARGRKRTATSRLPAKLKEPAAVARRNARERRRVKMVNDGFMRLRKHVPTDPKNKKLSKVKTLRLAIDYIKHLQQLLIDSSNKPTNLVGLPIYSQLTGIPEDVEAVSTSWLHTEALVSVL